MWRILEFEIKIKMNYPETSALQDLFRYIIHLVDLFGKTCMILIPSNYPILFATTAGK